MEKDSLFWVMHNIRSKVFECQKCDGTDEIKVTGWKNGIEIECKRCGFSQFYRAEEPKETYDD